MSGRQATTELGRELRFWLICFVVFFAAVYLLRGILLPFVAGMAVAYLLDPSCDWLQKRGLSRTAATTLLTLVFLVVLVGALLLAVPLLVNQIVGLGAQFPEILAFLQAKSAQVLELVEARIDPEMLARIEAAVAGSAKDLVKWIGQAISGLISGVDAALSLASLLVITPVVTFYLLRDWDHLVARIDSWLPRHYAETVRREVRNVDEILAGFVRGQSSVCLILALFYAVGLTVAGLNFGLVIGLMAGLLSFIPFVGSAVGFVASVGMALVQFDDWLRIGIVAAIFVIGQAAEGNFLTPKLVGDRVGLHPVWVIFALLAGGFLFGFVGVLLAVPVAAVVGVLTRFLLAQYLDSSFHRGEPAGAPDGAGGDAAGDQA